MVAFARLRYAQALITLQKAEKLRNHWENKYREQKEQIFGGMVSYTDNKQTEEHK